MIFAFGYLLGSLIVSIISAIFQLLMFAFTLLLKTISFIASIIREHRNRRRQTRTQTNVATQSQQH